MCEFAKESSDTEKKTNEKFVKLKIWSKIDAEFVEKIINQWKFSSLWEAAENISGKIWKVLIGVWEKICRS